MSKVLQHVALPLVSHSLRLPHIAESVPLVVAGYYAARRTMEGIRVKYDCRAFGGAFAIAKECLSR